MSSETSSSGIGTILQSKISNFKIRPLKKVEKIDASSTNQLEKSGVNSKQESLINELKIESPNKSKVSKVEALNKLEDPKVETQTKNQIGKSKPSAPSTTELHRSKIKKSESLIGLKLSELSKKLIGSTKDETWTQGDSFGITNLSPTTKLKASKSLTTETSVEPKLKSILKSPSASKYLSDEKKRGKFGKVTLSERNLSKRIERKPKVSFDLASIEVRKNWSSQDLPKIFLEKQEGVSKLNLNHSPPLTARYQKILGRESTIEKLNVVNGHAYLAPDEESSSNYNTFAESPENRSTFHDLLQFKPLFRQEVNMEGFLNSEIHFQTDNTSLVVTGLRGKRNGLNARKVTEVLEFPDGIFYESLLISRDERGMLLVEEYLR